MVPKPGGTSSSKEKYGPDDIDTLLPAIVTAVVLCSILTTGFTAARLLTKRLASTYDLDDYMLLAAWVASIAFSCCLLAAGLSGFGRHNGHIHQSLYVILNKYTWDLEILYLPAIWLAKASLLFQLMRLLAPTKSGAAYWNCHGLIWSNLLFYTSISFPIIFQCHPIWKLWKPAYEDHCIDWKTLLVASSAISMILDLLTWRLMVLPTWQLLMTSRRIASSIAIVVTGLLAFISSICRLVYTTHLLSSHDVSYIIAQTMLWSLTEITTIILCVSFPTLPQTVQLIRDRYPPPSNIHKPSASASASSAATPAPKKTIRKSKIFKIGNAQSSIGIERGVEFVSPYSSQEEVDLARLKSPYFTLEDVDEEEEGEGLGKGRSTEGKGGKESAIKELGSKRTVEIERHRMDRISCVPSMSDGGR